MQRELGLFSFWGCFLSYCILSFFLFVFTSHGWSLLLFNLIPLGIFYLLIFLIISYFLFTSKLKGEKSVVIPPYHLYSLFITQTLAILFNYGDYGDAGGAFNSFEVLVGISRLYREPLLGENIALGLSMLFKIVYIITLIIFMVMIFKGKKVRFQ